MDFVDILNNRRTIRRFKQQQIPSRVLLEMIDAARRAPSAANLQPMQYILITDESIRNQIFPFIKWAGYITPPWSPSFNERPTAYIAIIVMNQKNQYYQKDIGLASAHILFSAENHGIGSCILCNINRQQISSILNIPDTVLLDSLIALGYKNETSILEDNDSTVQYYRDDDNVLHVPKRTIHNIIHYNRYHSGLQHNP